MRTSDNARTPESYNAVAEFSYRVGIAVVIALLCMILVTSMRADTRILRVPSPNLSVTGPAAHQDSSSDSRSASKSMGDKSTEIPE